jgi:tetratricopeptide (TPR) repeat protein
MVDTNPEDESINNPETWKNKGNEFFSKGDFETALKCYRQAVEIDPSYLSGWNNYGLTLLKLGKIDEASQIKKKIEELRRIESIKGAKVSNKCQSCGAYLPYKDEQSPENQPNLCPECEVKLKDPIQSDSSENQGRTPHSYVKKPLTAGLLSIIPGLGQVYNGELGKGILILFGTIVGFLLIIPGLLIWIFGMYDAYKTAIKMNDGNMPVKEFKGTHIAGYFSSILVIILIVAGVASMIPNEPQINDYNAQYEAIPTLQYTPSVTPGPDFISTGQSLAQMKESAEIIPYYELFRNNKRHIGDTVYYRGTVIQVQNPYNDLYVFRIATDNYRDVLYVNSQGSPFMEYDEVNVWGTVKGMKTYLSVLGNSITIPEIDAFQIELINEPTPRITQIPKTFTPTPIVTDSPMTRYYNSNFLFSMNYPNSWYVNENDNSYGYYKSTNIEFSSAYSGDNRAKVTILAVNKDFGTIQDFYTEIFAAIDRDYDITVTGHQSQTIVGGQPAYRIDYYIEDDDDKIETKIVQVYVKYDEFYYVITYSAPWPRGNEVNIYDLYLSTAQNMINSIQFT